MYMSQMQLFFKSQNKFAYWMDPKLKKLENSSLLEEEFAVPLSEEKKLNSLSVADSL